MIMITTRSMLQHKGAINRQNRPQRHTDHLQVGATAPMHYDKTSNKLSTPFCPKPMVTIDIKGAIVTAADDRHAICRNASRFKKMFKPLPVSRKRVKLGIATTDMGVRGGGGKEVLAPPPPGSGSGLFSDVYS